MCWLNAKQKLTGGNRVELIVVLENTISLSKTIMVMDF